MKKSKRLPLVTIITPVFNREQYIEDTILSVLQQDYPNIEYIVFDDGSTDRSLEILKTFGKKIRLYSHKNIGEHRTVNKAFRMTKGEIVCVLSSDDLLLPRAVSTTVSVLSDNPEIISAYPDWIVIDENGYIKEKVRRRNYSYQHMVLRHDCLPGVGTFFRKSLLSKLHKRNESFTYVSDYDFWLRAGLVGDFIRIPQYIAAFREHPGSATTKDVGKKMVNEHLQVIDKLYQSTVLPKEIITRKGQAYASAYIVAGICFGSDVTQKYRMFLKSFLLYPPYATAKLIKRVCITPIRQFYFALSKRAIRLYVNK